MADTKPTIATAKNTDTTELERLVLRAKRRAHMDSNDGEIERLQEVLHEACALLNIDEEPIDEAAEAWAVEKGWI